MMKDIPRLRSWGSRFLLVFAFVVLPLLSSACRPQESKLPSSAEPDDAGLVWHECALSHALFDWKEAESCFGHPMPLLNDDEKANYGERIDDENLQLVVGQDVYRTEVKGSLLPMRQRYVLYRNEKPIATLRGEFGAHSPNISLQNVDGKSAWEFADEHIATIVYDGQDVRHLYGLDAAYRPYKLADKLVFIAQKDGRYFVVYNGFKIGPDFDQIVIAYCCESILYSVQSGQGKYLFNGSRGGQHYIVEITASEN